MSLNLVTLYFDAKDPGDKLDYTIDFQNWLEQGDTIATGTIGFSPSDLVLEVTVNTPTAVTAWLSGGTAGTEYTVSAHVTTVQGRVATRSAVLYVQNH